MSLSHVNLSIDGGTVQQLVKDAADLGYGGFSINGTALECAVKFTAARDGLPEFVYGHGATIEFALAEAVSAMQAYHDTEPG